jgi:hypothetical protein
LQATQYDGTENRPPPIPVRGDGDGDGEPSLEAGEPDRARAIPAHADDPSDRGDMNAVEAQVERARAQHERTEAELPE